MKVNDTNSKSFEDKVCIIAGAGHGLGRATAGDLASRGASVVLNDLGVSIAGSDPDKQPLRQTANMIRAADGDVIESFGDVTDFEYTQELVDRAIEVYDRLDLVVDFAGTQRDGGIHELTEDDWDIVVNTHLKGHFSLLRAATKHWRSVCNATNGSDISRSFIAVSSSRAMGNPGQANYSAAKAGILGLMRTGARELEPYNVRVNALIPAAKTRMTSTTNEHYNYPDVDSEQISPEKVTPMIGFLGSEYAADVTGCTFGIGGDGIFFVSDPEFTRSAFRDGGWTVEHIARQFDCLTYNESTSKTDSIGLLELLYGE